MLFTSVLPFIALSVSVSGLTVPTKDTLETRSGDFQAHVKRASAEVDSNVIRRQETENGVFERSDLAGPAENTIGTWEGLANGVLGSGVGVFGDGGSGMSQGSSQQAPRPIPQGGNRGGEGVQLGSGGGAARPQGGSQFGGYGPSRGGSAYGGGPGNGGGAGIGGGIYKREDATAEVTLE